MSGEETVKTIRKIIWWLTLLGALALFFLPFLLLAGCKPSSKTVSYPPPTRTISGSEAARALIATNINASSFALPDGKYLLPTLRWVESDFSSGFWQFKNEMGIATWIAEAGDCDDFSQSCSFYAKWLNRQSPNRNVAGALAMGELYYWRGGNPVDGHAINFFIISAGDTLQLVFYEPQTHSVVSLTEAERRSVFFWKL